MDVMATGKKSVLDNRATRAVIAIWTFLAVSALMLIGEIGELAGAIDLEYGMGITEAVYALVLVASFPAFILTVVFVAMWIHRAHANVIEAGFATEFTPGWAVGWYFIPFANLFKPYQAMRELWNTSHGDHDNNGDGAPGRLKLWWGAWIVGNILNNISFRLLLEADAGETRVATAIGAAGSVFTIAAAWLVMRLINDITAAQRSLVGQIETEDAPKDGVALIST